MTIYKLRILPLSLLVIGLTTLTSGCKKKDMSLKLNEPRNIRGVVSYKRSFPDLNDAHLEVAKKIGIRPLAVDLIKGLARLSQNCLPPILETRLTFKSIKRFLFLKLPFNIQYLIKSHKYKKSRA